MIGALLYLAIVVLIWRIGKQLLGSQRALLPPMLVMLSKQFSECVLGLSLPPNALSTAQLLATVAIPIPLVYGLGKLGAKASMVRPKLRPLVFVIWCGSIWALLAIYMSGDRTHFMLM